MDAQQTKCTSNARSFRNDAFYGDSYHYKVSLDGNGWFKPDYNSDYKVANGATYTTDYGLIVANTYTVNIDTNDDLVPMGVR